jgi:DNA (cytosine-5)-methyltransferase 1
MVLFADFFSGIGGFRLGLERAGHRCVFSCEIDPFARRVYGARFGREPEAEDIRAVTPETIPEADLWCGGFPCQDLSTAGRRVGIKGERSGLIWKLLDLARERRPRWLLLENVPGLLTGRDAEDDGADVSPEGRADVEAAGDVVSWFGTLLGAMDQLGYDVSWRVLDARFFGVPQRRRRVFILAGRAGERTHPGTLLLEREGRGGNPASRRAARARAAGGPQGGSGVAGGGDALIVPPVAATLTSGGTPSGSPPGRRHEDLDNLVAQPIAFDMAQVTHPENRASCRPGDPAPCLAATNQPHVAYCIESPSAKQSGGPEVGIGVKEGESYSLLAAPSKAHAVAYPISSDAAGGRTGDAKTLSPDAEGRERLRPASLGVGAEGDPSFALTAQAVPAVGVIPLDIRNALRDDGRTGVGTPSTGVGEAGDPAFTVSRAALQAVAFGGAPARPMAVRRLTPRECERLQGFPDDWTALEGAADSHRYRVLGNAVAVPVIEWIGRRLALAGGCA